jgi:hypothetical protein
MKKLATLLVSTALIGGVSLSAFVPAASAADTYRGMQRGAFAGQQMQQAPQGQTMQAPGMRGQNMMPGQGMRGQGMGPDRMAQGGLVHFACSVNGAPLLEIGLNNLNESLTLSDEQKTLFDAFKTTALTAQTSFADACKVPTVADDTPLSPVDVLKLRQTNATARIAAIDSVLPALETFYNSLTDEQKAELATPVRAGFAVEQGQFGPRGGHRGMGPGQNNFGPNRNNFGPGNGPGFGPGQGNSPGNMQAPVPQNNG